MPAVSVIIPCYNYGEYIEEAIDSVLASTFSDIEIVVINDGSTDKFTQDILLNLKKPKTRIWHQHNQGLSKSRNNGVLYTTGKYILPLDADDRIDSTMIEKCFWQMETNPSLGFVYTITRVFGQENYYWYSKDFDLMSLLEYNYIPVSSMIRRQAFLNSGGYKIEMGEGYEDWELWLSIIEAGWQAKRISEPLFFYRKHLGSIMEISFENHKVLREKIKKLHLDLYKKKYVLGYKKNLEFFYNRIKKRIPVSVKTKIKSLLHYFFIDEGF